MAEDRLPLIDDAEDRADLIYHESQTAALCGVSRWWVELSGSLLCALLFNYPPLMLSQVHAVNTLLQAPHFR
jgi:hypothetical protein